ncbi:MAG: hypothetical protein VR69_08300 [Peptococcaceae bacterium BRH_c4b]|nr:MAG: hypothetical protein VR69_08300 [Peptococcaceae bacterium BRH_c4b]
MGIAALKTKARELKKNIVVLYLAFKHPKTPLLAKIVIGIVVSYALSPIDLIPDFVPVLGYIDDLILIPAGIAIAIKLIPAEVLMECRERQNSLSGIKKNGVYAAILIVLIWLFILYLFLFHCF